MHKAKLANHALTLVILLYLSGFFWFVYVGPITTLRVKLKLAQHKQRVVISLTTTPYRISQLQPTLDSLLAQSIIADKIYLNIPYRLKRDDVEYSIPSWLLKYEQIEVVRTDDYGPITKLLPTLSREVNPNTIIITVDDDVAYPKQLVRDLVDYALQNPQVAVTPMNLNFYVDADYVPHIVSHKFVHASDSKLIVGAAGVAYRRDFFAADFSQLISTLPPDCFLCDDLVLSMYLNHRNIAVQQTTKNTFHPLVLPFVFKELPQKFSAHALSASIGNLSGNQTRYAQCLKSLQGTQIQSAYLALMRE